MEQQQTDKFKKDLANLNLYAKADLLNSLSNILKEQPGITLYESLEKVIRQFNLECVNMESIYDQENITAQPIRYSDSKKRSAISYAVEDIDAIHKFRENHPELHTLEQALKELDTRDMKYLRYNRQILAQCMFEMIKRLNLIEKFSIDETKLKNFIDTIAKNYKRVPYHNFTHAFNIVHFNYYILITSNLRDYLEDIDVLALILGSLGHDIDHPGANNMFYAKIGHQFAQMTNDQSILENYHAYNLFHILEREDCNILSSLKPGEFARFRKATIEGILGTDMSKHFALCGQFEALIKKIQEGNYNKSSTDDRDLIVKIFVHAADISGPTASFTDFKSWGLRVTQEFHDQFQAENEHPKCQGNPPLPFLEFKTLEGYINSQIGFTSNFIAIMFLDTFVVPLFKSISALFPELKELSEQIDSNLNTYKQELNQLNSL